MFAVCPRNNVVEDEMVFRLEPIGLGPTACECIQHDDLRSRLHAGGGGVLPCDKNAELVHNGARERRSLIVKKLVFAIVKVRCSLRQIDSADTLISDLQ